MNVWFDISNSPHIMMWHPLISDLRKRGHQITITARPLANTISLLNQYNLSYTVVGKHYGKNIIRKIFGYPVRIYQLWRFLKKSKVDVSISQSSFHAPIVAFLLGIPSVYTNDNEHALGNIPAFFFATKIFVPELMELPFYLKLFNSKISQYPGVKEGVYLWEIAFKIMNTRLQRQYGISRIYIRPEPSTAQYYSGKENFLTDLLSVLDNTYPVSILTRTKEQYQYYTSQNYQNIKIPFDPIPFEEIASDCLLFIGAGGSMTREMALMGIPTISVYQDQLLGVDKYLVSAGLMIHDPDLSINTLKTVIDNQKNNIVDTELIQKGQAAYDIIISTINNYKTDSNEKGSTSWRR
jgi:predicted glycosyltransferase